MNKLVEPKSYKILVIARSGYGKTHIAIQQLKKLIENKELNPRRLVIFSSTIRSNVIQIEFVKWLEKKCGKDYDYAINNTAKEIKFKFLENLYNQQEMLKEQGYKYKHWAIWFDDMQGEDGLYISHPIMKKLFLRGRHLALTILFNLQTYRSSLDPVLKDNVNQIFIGDLNSDESKLDVIRQFSSGVNKLYPKKSTETLYKHYINILDTENRHGFLHLNLDRTIGDGRFEINLSGKYLDNIFLNNKQDGTISQ